MKRRTSPHHPKAILASKAYDARAASPVDPRAALASALLEVDVLRAERDSARRELRDVRATLRRTRSLLESERALGRHAARGFRAVLADPEVYQRERLDAFAAGVL